MRTPDRLCPLIDQGVIQEVLRPLMSGKEADVYLVWSQGEERVAKVYKEANNRSFKHRADYTEGRRVRNTRKQRAMNKRSRYGRAEVEAEWRAAEVDIIYRLHAAGVRVPTPHDFVDGVLIMELIRGNDGEPAPRLVDVTFDPDEAHALFKHLLQEVVRMLCAGVVHGDLSDFNVLITPEGPVVIDFPQAVDPAANRNARNLLIRDVDNLTQFLARYDTRLRRTRYGQEMWQLYERGELDPETRLTGRFQRSQRKADTMSLLEEIEALERESRRKREALGLPPPRPARRPKLREGPPPKPITSSSDAPKARSEARSEARSGARSGARPGRGSGSGGPSGQEPGPGGGKRRRRRRRKRGRQARAPEPDRAGAGAGAPEPDRAGAEPRAEPRAGAPEPDGAGDDPFDDLDALLIAE